jgi:hypothetical protein
MTIPSVSITQAYERNSMKRNLFVVTAYSILALTLHAQQMQPWLTRSADSARTGWNSHETSLTQANVKSKGVSFKTVVPLVGDARGMEAQPLILPGVTTSRGVRDVMVLPSMADVVRGVDAHDGSGIWQVTLGTPIQGSGAIDFHNINDKWGCLSTGVIDPDTARYYQVCWVSPDNSQDPKSAQYKMFVLNVADGSQVVPPVLIDGLDFNKGMRKARSSAVLINQNGVKTILQCTGSVQETTNGPSGYCFAFDVATNKVTTMMATTQKRGAGIWMAGSGLACDKDQDCYAITGNGAFDGVSQWGESFIKLRYTPPSSKWSITGHPGPTLRGLEPRMLQRQWRRRWPASRWRRKRSGRSVGVCPCPWQMLALRQEKMLRASPSCWSGHSSRRRRGPTRISVPAAWLILQTSTSFVAAARMDCCTACMQTRWEERSPPTLQTRRRTVPSLLAEHQSGPRWIRVMASSNVRKTRET